MSLRFPPRDSHLNEMFRVEDIQEVIQGRGIATTLNEAKSQGVRTCRANPTIRSVVFLVLRHNDDLQLVQIGRRGGVTVLWNFGRVYVEKPAPKFFSGQY